MTQHITQWLEAFHDGELKSSRTKQVEAHLETCKICRIELDCLESISSLLLEYPKARNLTPADTFLAQVGLRLQRKPGEGSWQEVFRVAWQWVPVGLLTAWVFVQTAFIVRSVLNWVLRLVPGMEQLTGFLLNDTQKTSLIEDAAILTGVGFGELGRFGLDILKGGGPLGWGITINLGLTIMLGLLYISWLASWWIQKSNGENS